VEEAPGIADDEAAGETIPVRHHEDRVMSVGWQLEYPRDSDGFPRLEQYVEGDGGGVGYGIVTAAAIVHEVDKRTAPALGSPAGPAGYAERHDIADASVGVCPPHV
jgi:hypothetical protein